MLVTSFSQTQKKVYVNVCVYTFCELHITFILWTRFFSAFYAAMNETNRLDERNEYTNTVENVCYCNTLISCYAFIVVAMTMLMVLLLILPFFWSAYILYLGHTYFREHSALTIIAYWFQKWSMVWDGQRWIKWEIQLKSSSSGYSAAATITY